jgi:predicted AAA+ superfamily ATPase
LGLHLNTSSFPVGKVSFETLRPMSFTEFLFASDPLSFATFMQSDTIAEIVHDRLWTLLKHYFIVGGLPEAVACYIEHKKTPLEAFTQVRKKQDDLLSSYYADIAKHAGKVNAMHIDRVLKSIPKQLQQTHDGSTSRFKFKDVIPGISHYDRLVGAIDWLESAGLAIKIHIVNSGHLPFAGHSKENLFKLLLFDVGILGSMVDLSPQQILQYEYGSYKGFFAENFVAEEFLALGKETLYSWQEQTSEIEFLLELDGSGVPIEVKSGTSTKAKSLHTFANKYHPHKKIVLSAKPSFFDTRHQTDYYPLYALSKFL